MGLNQTLASLPLISVFPVPAHEFFQDRKNLTNLLGGDIEVIHQRSFSSGDFFVY